MASVAQTALLASGSAVSWSLLAAQRTAPTFITPYVVLCTIGSVSTACALLSTLLRTASGNARAIRSTSSVLGFLVPVSVGCTLPGASLLWHAPPIAHVKAVTAMFSAALIIGVARDAVARIKYVDENAKCLVTRTQTSMHRQLYAVMVASLTATVILTSSTAAVCLVSHSNNYAHLRVFVHPDALHARSPFQDVTELSVWAETQPAHASATAVNVEHPLHTAYMVVGALCASASAMWLIVICLYIAIGVSFATLRVYRVQAAIAVVALMAAQLQLLALGTAVPGAGPVSSMSWMHMRTERVLIDKMSNEWGATVSGLLIGATISAAVYSIAAHSIAVRAANDRI